jgi:hypothetical protein
MCAASWVQQHRKSTIAKMRKLSRASDQLGWKKASISSVSRARRVENLCMWVMDRRERSTEDPAKQKVVAQ